MTPISTQVYQLWHEATVHAFPRDCSHYCAKLCLFCFLWPCGPTRAMAPSFTRFLDHTKRRTTVGRTPLDEWSARRRDLYLTTHNTHTRQISMPTVGFEPKISVGERPQTYALDRAATETGTKLCGWYYYHFPRQQFTTKHVTVFLIDRLRSLALQCCVWHRLHWCWHLNM